MLVISSTYPHTDVDIDSYYDDIHVLLRVCVKEEADVDRCQAHVRTPHKSPLLCVGQPLSTPSYVGHLDCPWLVVWIFDSLNLCVMCESVVRWKLSVDKIVGAATTCTGGTVEFQLSFQRHLN